MKKQAGPNRATVLF